MSHLEDMRGTLIEAPTPVGTKARESYDHAITVLGDWCAIGLGHLNREDLQTLNGAVAIVDRFTGAVE